jgi:hypothetical protein
MESDPANFNIRALFSKDSLGVFSKKRNYNIIVVTSVGNINNTDFIDAKLGINEL